MRVSVGPSKSDDTVSAEPGWEARRGGGGGSIFRAGRVDRHLTRDHVSAGQRDIEKLQSSIAGGARSQDDGVQLEGACNQDVGGVACVEAGEAGQEAGSWGGADCTCCARLMAACRALEY